MNTHQVDPVPRGVVVVVVERTQFWFSKLAHSTRTAALQRGATVAALYFFRHILAPSHVSPTEAAAGPEEAGPGGGLEVYVGLVGHAVQWDMAN